MAYFGASKNLRDITAGDADEWRQWMLVTQAATTVSREVKRTKQFFRAAVRKKLIPENPFVDLPAPEQINNAREFFVTPKMAEDVLRACPDIEWQLIFALCRYGGLRCPSEVLRLRWVDIDWERNRVTIHASKTEHHRDGGICQIPMFPELRPHLEAAWGLAEKGATHVIGRYRQATGALVKAIGWHLDDACLNGTGAGQPLGVLNDPAMIEVAKEGEQPAATINYTNVTKMFARLHPACVSKSVWVCKSTCIPHLLALTIEVGDGGDHYPVLTGNDGKWSMLTRPVLFTEKTPALGSAGDVLLADFSQYTLGLPKMGNLAAAEYTRPAQRICSLTT